MKRAAPFLLGLALGLVLALLYDSRDAPPARARAAVGPEQELVEQRGGASDAHELLAPGPSAPGPSASGPSASGATAPARREDVAAGSVDPCATVAEDLASSRASLADARTEIERLRRELDVAALEIERLRFPDTTPYGAFLASGEAEQILDDFAGVTYVPRNGGASRPAGPAALDWVRAWVDEFPVILHPGEATWIAERSILGDWSDFGPGSSQDVLLRFLGPDRVAAEVPPERLAELKAEHAADGFFE